MHAFRNDARRALSVVQLVVVVVIIGIMAAIAVPRLSRGNPGPADPVLAGNLSVLRSGITQYAMEHGGLFPTVANFEAQLTQYTDAAGVTSTKRSTNAIYGPYLSKVPALLVGGTGHKNSAAIVDGSSGAPGSSAGAWFYNPSTGEIKANLADSEKDAANKPYNAY